MSRKCSKRNYTDVFTNTKTDSICKYLKIKELNPITNYSLCSKCCSAISFDKIIDRRDLKHLLLNANRKNCVMCSGTCEEVKPLKTAASPEKYSNCKQKLNELDDTFTHLESYSNDPENFIYEHFNEIIYQVDIRRESLKLQIDNISDEIIQSIKMTELECKRSISKIATLTEQLDESKRNLNQLMSKFNSTQAKMDDILMVDLIKKADELKPIFKNKLIKLKNKLLGDKIHSFECGQASVESVFGSFISQRIFEGSNILPNFEDQIKLRSLCGFSNKQLFKLAYQASVHGFSAKSFHNKCDQAEKTLTIIKTTENYIFGGYTEQNWSGKKVDKFDPNAFIFSFINKDKKPIKIKCAAQKEAIECNPLYGPTFGVDCSDIYISNDSNLNRESFSYLGNSYKHPLYAYQSREQVYSFLAGKHSFQTVEIEVYTAI